MTIGPQVRAYLTLGGAEADENEAAGGGQASRSFTIIKEGPAEGEMTTEVRELLTDGSLRCTFTHHNPRSGDTVTIVRYYRRAG